MKFRKNIVLFVILSIMMIEMSFSFLNNANSNADNDMYKEVQSLIKKIAEQKMKNSNIEVKRRLIGILPEGYPQETVERALKIRKDRRRWNKVMMIPTELYRMCLYPFARVNYEKWCNNVFLGAKTKITSNNNLYNSNYFRLFI
jgi:hypothetical protein